MTDRDFPKFPHLENLNRAQSVLAAPRVWITEKIDGFNVRFTRQGDGLLVGTRNKIIDPIKEPSQGFGPWISGLGSTVHMMLPGEVFYGEWAGKGILGRIDYGEPSFWLFAIQLIDGSWAEPTEVTRAAWEFGWNVVPTLYHGAPLPVEMLDEMRQAPSVAAPGQFREGIVITPYPAVFDEHGHRLIAKFKSPAFEERASQRKTAVPTIIDLTAVQPFVDEYVTAERLVHVLEQVREAEGGDPLDPRLTGPVLKTMYEDVVREGAADFAALSEADQKYVGEVVNRATKPLLDAARVKSIAA